MTFDISIKVNVTINDCRIPSPKELILVGKVSKWNKKSNSGEITGFDTFKFFASKDSSSPHSLKVSVGDKVSFRPEENHALEIKFFCTSISDGGGQAW